MALPQPPTAVQFDKDDRPSPVWTRWLLQVYGVLNGLPELPAYTVATLPAATDRAGRMLYVSDASGGAVPAFSDGTSWRRVTDRTVIS